MRSRILISPIEKKVEILYEENNRLRAEIKKLLERIDYLEKQVKDKLNTEITGK